MYPRGKLNPPRSRIYASCCAPILMELCKAQIQNRKRSDERSIVSIILDEFCFSRNFASPLNSWLQPCLGRRLSATQFLVPYNKGKQRHRRSFLSSKFQGFRSRFSAVAFPPISPLYRDSPPQFDSRKSIVDRPL